MTTTLRNTEYVRHCLRVAVDDKAASITVAVDDTLDLPAGRGVISLFYHGPGVPNCVRQVFWDAGTKLGFGADWSMRTVDPICLLFEYGVDCMAATEVFSNGHQ